MKILQRAQSAAIWTALALVPLVTIIWWAFLFYGAWKVLIFAGGD